MKHGTVFNIAHRGASSIAPENTLIAARKAYELGAHMWETDVAVTKDGQLILFHNDSLAHTTNAASRFPDRKPWCFAAFTLEEIRSLDAGSWFLDSALHPQAECLVSKEELESYREAKVPTLAEAIELTRSLDWKINLEIKEQPEPLRQFPIVDQLLEEIDRMQFPADRFVVSSFRHSWLRKIQRQKPSFKVEALVRFPERLPLNRERFTFDTYNIDRGLIGKSDLRKIAEKGLRVNLYNVNSREDMIRFIEAGASGIITDFPQTMRSLGYYRAS